MLAGHAEQVQLRTGRSIAEDDELIGLRRV
jgi:hypothetical protein